MSKVFRIGDRQIGGSAPCYVIAEVSCNHDGDFDEACRIIDAAADAGADAVKLQTYKAETITRNFKRRPTGTIWEDMDLFALYQKAQTPWEWHARLAERAAGHGMHMFSSPFDETAVDFLEEQNVPVYKVASFEAVDTKLMERIAATGKPVILSNGMTDYLEMEEAIRTLRNAGVRDLAVLHCNSGYPAAFREANLKTIPAIEAMFGVVPGVSDHTMFLHEDKYETPLAHITPVEAVRFGAKVVEVHLMLDRAKARALMEKGEGGFDWPFSREPQELKKMISMIRAVEAGQDVAYESEDEKKAARLTHGKVCFQPTEKEMASRNVRPCLWVVEPIKAGEAFKFTGGPGKPGNFDSIRPAGGLHIRFTDFIEGRAATRDLDPGEPLEWDMVNIEEKQ